MELTNLNNKQLEAVKTTEGPLLVLAGAGSGKTKVLTTRIVYLIEEIGIDPSNILAITFTNKAAKEMRDRVIRIIGNIGYKCQISTFHSFGLLLIRENYEKLGYEKNFTILDSDDSTTVIKKIIKDMGLDPKYYNPKMIKNKISSAKNELMDPDEYSKYALADIDEKVFSIYRSYQTKLKNSNSLDFDDLLMLPIELLSKHPDVLKKYQDRFKYILIDEYQDTNHAQYILTKMISAKYKNICVVGDNDQSIYAFRGANYKNILNFEHDYNNSKMILLEENYRSTKNILNVANDVIKNNKERKDKNLWTSNDDGEKVKYHRSDNEKDEAFYVLDTINRLIKKGVSKSEIAVLYRTNAQSRSIEDVLLRENIPYRVIGSFYFYKRKEIKDLIAYLKVIYNPNDDVNLTRIINMPKRGIGLKTIDNLSMKAAASNISMFECIDSGKELEFKKLMEQIIKEKETMTLTELIDYILDVTKMKQELESEKSLEADIRLENLEEFKSITKHFEEKDGIISLESFLEEISLVADMEEYKNNTDVVTLMTIHSSKGLEFDNIIITGLEEGIFPHSNSFSDNSELEEERRLCYVAVTRAKKNLWLVNARKRTLFGQDSYNMPSRFIKEINEDLLETDFKEKEEVKVINKAEMIDETAEYSVGDKVTHETFGLGVVVGISKSILTIAFSSPHGIKTLMKGHKSIRKV